MEKEILACIKKKDIKFLHSGQISKYVFPMEREEAHQKNISHLIIRFFVVTISSNNELLYLVQKRSKNKKSFPYYFTDSASGHVVYKENLNLNDIKENAKRELEEEFGIPPEAIKNIRFYDLDKEANQKTTEIAYVFFGLVDNNVKIKPNPNELDGKDSKFYTKSELINLLKNEKLIDRSKRIWNKIIDLDIFEYFGLNNKKEEKKTLNHDIALFIGRFQPLHHGHIYVITRILEKHENLKIGIGSSQIHHIKTDPFTSQERRKFLKAAMEKRNVQKKLYKIYEIPDLFNASKWVDHVVSIVNNFNILYSNSDWVRELFNKEGFEIAKKISIFKNKFNGDNIRKLIAKDNKKYRDLVPNEVINLIEDFNGIERIKRLYQEKE